MAAQDPRADRGWPYLPVEPGRPVLEPAGRACRLPPDALRTRAREIREAFVAGILEVEELADGFVYWFERTDEWFARVSEFAFYESRC